MDAVILCGGRGTRLASIVSDLPKPLAPVAGRPFLDYLLHVLSESELVQRIVMATGYQAEQIIATYGRSRSRVPIDFIREAEPLGTGGAIANVLRHGLSDPFFALNGDSLVQCDLAALVATHQNFNVDATLALASVPDASRFGSVTLDGSMISAFLEKTGESRPGLINAGIYVLSQEAFRKAPPGAFSIERDLFPTLVAARRVASYIAGDRFLDIGTPETYREAASLIRHVLL